MHILTLVYPMILLPTRVLLHNHCYSTCRVYPVLSLSKKKIFSYSWWPPLRGCVLLIPHLHLVLNNGHTVQLLTSLYSCSSILLYRLNTFSSTFNRSRMPTLLFTFSLLNTYHYEVRLLNNDTSFLKRSSLMTLLYQHFLLFILCIFLNSTFLTNTMH